jgi:hypothetical protein
MFTFVIICFCSPLAAQQQLAYSFGETPQTLMLNPGAETNFKYHYGIPVFSNVSFNAGIKGFDLSELFLKDNQSFESKFQRVLDRLEETDYVNFNVRIDLLNGGYRYDDKTYLSFGFYEEVDFIFYIPKDIIELGYYGNQPFGNRSFSLSQIVMKADMLGVLHAGISRKVNKRLNIGARVKLYSSSFNVETNHNSGTFTTSEGNNNIIQQTLNNVKAEVRTSGLIDADDQFIENTNGLLSRTFLGGNFGLGFDFGMTYHFTPQLEFTASILDLGFIRHSSNSRTYSAEGDYTFEGINFQYDPDNPRDYWQELEDDFDQNIPTTDLTDPYTSWRPTKINAAIKYSFGELRRKACYTDTHKKYYFTAIGAQINTIMRPRGPQLAFTSFFETSLTPKLHTRATYTINDFSATILGGGLTFQWGNVNVFGVVDNMLGARDLLSANNISFNFGVNMVIE